jgi:hypothetical protein
MQAQPQPVTQLPPLPPEPHCFSWHKGSGCDVQRQTYNQAVEARNQAYIQQQRELAAQQAKQETTNELQVQIDALKGVNAGLQQQLANMQQKLAQQTTDAFNAKVAAHDEGAFNGFIVGVGVVLVLMAVVIGVNRLMTRFQNYAPRR